MRRDEQHHLGLVCRVFLVLEQAARDRQVGKAGHLVGAAAVLVADEAREHLRLAIVQPERGRRVARADRVGDGARRRLGLRADVAHLKPDLDAHVVLEEHLWLDLELQADVEVVHRLGDEARGARGGRDHRHLVADVDARLLAVLRADARIGEDVGAADLLAQVERDQRVAHGQVDEATVQVARLGARDLAGDALGAHQADADLGGPLDARGGELVGGDFQHLDFQHHFRLALVLVGDQLLRHADRLGRVAHHEQVQLLVDEEVTRLDELAHHVGGLLHVRVGEVEAAHHQVLVVPGLRRRVGIDQDGVVVEDLAVELVGHQHEADHFLDGGVAHEHGGLRLGLHVLVEDEVEAGLARDQLEHRAQRRIAELHGDGAL